MGSGGIPHWSPLSSGLNRTDNRYRPWQRKGALSVVRIPAMPIANSNLMAIRIPIDADHHRSEATLDCTYHR